MLGKRLLFIPTVLAVTAAPYFLFEDGWGVAVKQKVKGLLGGSGGEQTGALESAGGRLPQDRGSSGELGAGVKDGGQPGKPAPQLAGAPVGDLREVLRFDVSPTWVTSRWSRVSTTVAELELQGFRVPLVTGTGTDDLAGALTYYFDKHNQVQRITFYGYTGDHRRLVTLATQYFGLEPQPSLNAGLYLAKWNGVPTSALRVAAAPVLQAGAPNSRLQVLLEINRPAERYQLSREFQQLLERDRQQRKW